MKSIESSFDSMSTEQLTQLQLKLNTYICERIMADFVEAQLKKEALDKLNRISEKMYGTKVSSDR